MKLSAVGAAIFIALWIALVFIAKIPSGWVHLPLAIGAVLIAVAIAADRRP
jgi:uncharacterized membrane protein